MISIWVSSTSISRHSRSTQLLIFCSLLWILAWLLLTNAQASTVRPQISWSSTSATERLNSLCKRFSKGFNRPRFSFRDAQPGMRKIRISTPIVIFDLDPQPILVPMVIEQDSSSSIIQNFNNLIPF